MQEEEGRSRTSPDGSPSYWRVKVWPQGLFALITGYWLPTLLLLHRRSPPTAPAMFWEGWRWQCSDPPESESEVFRAISQVHWLQIKEEKQAGLVYLENHWAPRNCIERAGSCIFISSALAVLAQCDILVHNNMLWDGGVVKIRN